MPMIRKTTMLVLAGFLAATASEAARANVVASENFQSYAANSDLMVDNGWLLPAGQPSGTWSVLSDGSNVITSVSSNRQTYKTFSPSTSIPDGTTNYYISYDIRPTTGSYVYGGGMALWNTSGASPADTNVGPFFGVTSGAAPTFYIRTAGFGATITSTTAVTGGHWYKLRLQITINATDLSLSTGTLYIQDITAGDTSFSAVSNLTNVSLGLTTSARDPKNYTAWRITSGAGTKYDNLEFGYGALPVPEPATLGLAAMIVPAMMLRRKTAGH